MVKHNVDSHSIVQSAITVLTARDSAVDDTNNTQVAQIDVFGEGTLCGCIHFFPDGSELQRPGVRPDGVIDLYCNICQYDGTLKVLEVLQSEDGPAVFIYHSSLTNAGLHCGQDPFEQTGPISF